ncbi:hypothetical protein [Hyphomicrobium sp.]|jgi:hypothetical protein|uniref:hypothetical protein n=1 Tax=Hyphomicrobium sp. TaxID=82 RepID=UPI002B7D0C98|nr:hypothetical protein [Hyphomicrobium sp.]HVZ04633.1 hypothetical protein [Hyphomicrobium sp.]
MYFIIIALLLFVLPFASVVIEAMLSAGVDVLWLVGKWFVFWACGVRLFIAGMKQTLQPAFTAKSIFEIDAPAAYAIVREVGFGNLSMGALSLATLAEPRWLVPAAIVTGLYYGLAGLGHLFREGNIKERVALWTDLWAFAILAIFVIHQLT